MAGQPTSGSAASGGTGNNNGSNNGNDNNINRPELAEKPKANYRGFVAGVFSGIAKLSGMSACPLSWVAVCSVALAVM